jgi:SAM-dependent methyltransferase
MVTQSHDDGARAGTADAVVRHYGAAPLVSRIENALRTAGLADGVVSWEDLAPLDQFHVQGLAASREVADAMNPAQGASIIDVGCGVGGASRFLAATYGVRVTGIDLTPAFIEAAKLLSERAGLSDRTRFAVADATELPYEDASFDHAWTQHVAMNIRDRERLYSEIHRVVKPGGLFAIHDIVEGNGNELRFPVPWARDASTSHLVNQAAMRAALQQAGFEVISWKDTTEPAQKWVDAVLSRRSSGGPPPVLGLGVITGPDLPAMIANMGWGMAEGRIKVVQVLARA